MATVIFYEKPGCVNNTKQKALLQAAGHTVDARNLITEAWTDQRLQPFLRQYPVEEWFNRSAPMIKSGEVIPEHLDPTVALQLIIKQPLLIRRPLLQSGDRYAIGFDINEIEAWLGLTTPAILKVYRQHSLKSIHLQTASGKHAPHPSPFSLCRDLTR
jgi:nitrogenase-associated protein